MPPRLRLAALDATGTQLVMHNPQDNSLLTINLVERTVSAISVRWRAQRRAVPPQGRRTLAPLTSARDDAATSLASVPQIPQFTNYKTSVMLSDLAQSGVVGTRCARGAGGCTRPTPHAARHADAPAGLFADMDRGAS